MSSATYFVQECPTCGRRLQVRVEYLGKSLVCVHCRGAFQAADPDRASRPMFEQPDVTCCYARSTKAWVRDPNGVAWETFVSRGSSAVYGDGSETRAARVAGGEGIASGCCV